MDYDPSWVYFKSSDTVFNLADVTMALSTVTIGRAPGIVKVPADIFLQDKDNGIKT